jgi:hypothetical protein
MTTDYQHHPTAARAKSIDFLPIDPDTHGSTVIAFHGDIVRWDDSIYLNGKRLASKDGETWYLGAGAGQYDGAAVTIEED